MIFVTVGSQVPFDRMIKAVETWAMENGCTDEMFYQIGAGTPPKTGQWRRLIPPDEYRRLCQEACIIVGHAGTGIWMTSAELAKRLILFPRRFAFFHEHRNEHQYNMCLRLASKKSVTIAFTVEELHAYLNTPECIIVPDSKSFETDELINAIRLFIHTGTLPPKKC